VASTGTLYLGATGSLPPQCGKVNRAEKAMSKTPNYFTGKTIIITGAASGIRRATAPGP
jgi:hypothetical protein